ncbi:MAG: DnaJ domain-containing protein [Pyrinomonadaceae bacterium]|nr:DnaJ domain-containing protein [Pyrinomonadaceae bacterium]
MDFSFGDNPYKTLGINRNATEAEIKHAYFNRVREHSPERDPEGFKQIRAAYEKLSAAAARAETDLFLMDDQEASVNESSLQRYDAEPHAVTLKMIESDLLAVESILLLEQLKSRS